MNASRKPSEISTRDTFPSQHCKLVYFRTRLHVDITPNEQISRDLHQRLPELFFFKYYSGFSEHPDWQSS